MRALVRILFIVAVATIVPTSSSWAQAGERTVYVSVLDKTDSPVAGLSASEFIFREDGVAREVLRASAATEPLQIALLVDTSQVIEEHLLDLRSALRGFFKEMGGKHEIALIGTGERPTVLVDYTRDVARLEKGLGTLFPRQGSGTYVMEAITSASDGLRRRKASRPTIISITARGPEFSEAHHASVLERLRESGVALHSIALTKAGEARTEREAQELEMVLAEGTRMTGGRRDDLLTSMMLTNRLQSLAAELNSQYQITYARPRTLLPPNVLEVSVKRPGLTARARRWP
ncbi:MAG TPA: VWA domain-containing protein [Vicinamibacterales bacterium]|nr:VWA domain-containing protein [Vicinamibacterales bacterium]